MLSTKYLSAINPFERVNRKIFNVNPTVQPSRSEPIETNITIYSYDLDTVAVRQTTRPEDCMECTEPGKHHWIDVGGLRKEDIDKIGSIFNIHSLTIEDILSIGQRPKMDESDDFIFNLLYMMYYNATTQGVELEQVSILTGKNFVISFQEDPSRDVFDRIRSRLQVRDSRLRTSGADYLMYTLIDVIVDNYFVVLERLGEKIESLEDEIIRKATTATLARINFLRKEMLLIKRNIAPVRELINGILRSESELIDDRTEKYLKDVYDHIVQANELSENYRDMVLNLHDLYLSELNLRMNEVMKVMAIVTCLLAPATVIGGIFGMNFQRMPWLSEGWGFYLAVAAMLLIPVGMIYIFKRRGWF